MGSGAIEVLNFAHPDVHAAAAGRLLVAEDLDRADRISSENSDVIEHDVQKFMTSLSEAENYGLIVPEIGLVAAATVLYAEADPQNLLTLILRLAVHPKRRRHGYGTRMVQHIAEQALERGHAHLEYLTDLNYQEREEEGGFLSSLPFEEPLEGHLKASVQELLA